MINFLGSGNNDHAHMVADLMAFDDFRSLRQILQTAVGAGADYYLIDFYVMAFAGRMGVFRQMRISDYWYQLVQLNIQYAGIFCVLVGSYCFPGTGYAAFLQKFNGLFINGENAVLAACFNSHVADGQTVGHGQLGNAVAAEFQGLVAGAVDADHADNGENNILAAHISGQRAGQVDLNSLGYFEPGGAAGHSAADIGLAHAGAQRVQRAVGAGVGVGADNDFTGSNQALVRQQSVFDAHAAYLKVIFDFVLAGEVAHALAHSSGFYILAGRKMVGDQSNFIFVKYRLADSFKFGDSRRTGNIVG